MAKNTYEKVKNHIESHGLKLLSTEYINQMQHLDLECSEGHTFKRRWKMIIRDGLECPKCSKVWTTNKVKRYLDEHYKGYLLLSEYVNIQEILTIQCPDGHIINISWFRFQQLKDKCQQCKKESRKKEFEELAEEEGYKVWDYKGNNKALVQCCKLHKPYEVTITKFKQGQRCFKCLIEHIASLKRHSFEFVKDYIEIESKSNYKLLSDHYQNNETELIILCDNGHIYPTNFIKFYNMHSRCPHCFGNAKYTFEYVKYFIEVESNSGYKLLSDHYINNKSPLDVICDKGHVTTTTFDNFLHEHRCWECRNINNSGANNYNWKGGISKLNDVLRLTLDDWKVKSLKSTNYTCDITGKKGFLEIHHVYPFHKILNNVLNKLNINSKKTVGEYSVLEIEAVKKEFLKYHELHLGKPLLPEVHSLYHSIFGNDTDENDYEEFKLNYGYYKAGETDERIS